MGREWEREGLGSVCGVFGLRGEGYNKGNVCEGFGEDVIECMMIEKGGEYGKWNGGLGGGKLDGILKEMFEDRGWLGGGEGFIEMVGKDGVMVGIKGGRGYKRRDWEDN